MFRSPKDIFDVASFIFTSWKFTALPVYKLEGKVGTKERRFVSLQWKTHYIGVVGMVLLFFLTLRIMYSEPNEIIDINVSLLEIGTIFIENIGIIILSHKHEHKIVDIISAFTTAEKLLVNLTQRHICYHKNIRNTILKIAVIKYTLAISDCLVDSITIPEDRASLIIYFITWVFHFHYELIILLYLFTLKKQYQELRKYLQFNKNKQFTYEKIKRVLEIFRFLRKISYVIQKTFEESILLKIINDLIITSTGIYYEIQATLKDGSTVWGNVSNVLFVTLLFISDFLVAFVFDGILKQDKMLCREIDDILNKANDELLPPKEKQIINISVYVNKMEFMVCGFFRLDFTVTGWMITGVATYVIYLVQFNMNSDD